MSTRHYHDLEVWQLAMRLAHAAYDCTSRKLSRLRQMLTARQPRPSRR